MNSVDKMWNVLEHGKLEADGDYTPGLQAIAAYECKADKNICALWVAVVVKAARDHDYKFFIDGRFAEIAKRIGLNKRATMHLIERIWEHTENEK